MDPEAKILRVGAYANGIAVTSFKALAADRLDVPPMRVSRP